MSKAKNKNEAWQRVFDSIPIISTVNKHGLYYKMIQ